MAGSSSNDNNGNKGNDDNNSTPQSSMRKSTGTVTSTTTNPIEMGLGSDCESSFSDENERVNDIHDSMNRSSTNTTGRSRSQEQENNETIEYAKIETAQITRLRVIVCKGLMLATLVAGAVAYSVSKNSQDDTYAEQYQAAGLLILETFQDIFDSKLSLIASIMGVSFMDLNGKADWPFVTLTSFPQHAATTLKESGAIYLHINPLVTEETRSYWEHYVVGDASEWISQLLDYQESVHPELAGLSDESFEMYGEQHWPIWYKDEEGFKLPVAETKPEGLYLPTWQTSPVIYGGSAINEDILESHLDYSGAALTALNGSVALSNFLDPTEEDTELLLSLLLSASRGQLVEYDGSPVSQVFIPIYDSFPSAADRKVVAVMVAWVHWLSYFEHLLPANVEGIQVVLENRCNKESTRDSYTFQIDGETVVPLGKGDLHEESFEQEVMETSTDTIDGIADGTREGLPFDSDHCQLQLSVYPSTKFREAYISNLPAVMVACVLIVFVAGLVLFCVYDVLVKRNQTKVLNQAAKSNALVASLFPEPVRKRLMEQADLARKMNDSSRSSSFVAPSRRLKGYLAGDDKSTAEEDNNDNPIADLFPYCTVMFADIAGFTAWSSTRAPEQVFVLLQTLYEAFDSIAKRRKVFKVETIGDSYLAVTGLPEPQENHAVIMARFAADCNSKMSELTSRLESRLGPETSTLCMRFGLHSGPVTAGVLKGERARFQLFGDTVNTAARMESTGIRGRIQVSETTKELLVQAGKAAWLEARADLVHARGKGFLQTYFVYPGTRKKTSSSCGDSTDNSSLADLTTEDLKTNKSTKETREERLVDWIVDLLREHIQKLVAKRRPRLGQFEPVVLTPVDGQTPLEEVAEEIVLPEYDNYSFQMSMKSQQVEVETPILRQLHLYVSALASMYHDNSFHNFEHACHVTLSTHKFLKRIVAPDIDITSNVGSDLHNYTHGINTDPLTLLAILFAALIHDVDHRGVSNVQLSKENKEMGDKYHGKSVAEQNSLDLAWDLLMEDRFLDLRNCLFTTKAEISRFRQVLVNVVLATDIFDKELNELRKRRWAKAFSGEVATEPRANALKATIVIEHIIQAADVSHTMQHWHIYRNWNMKLFKELYVAFKNGRLPKDPSEFWYNGEIGFFDNYVIPLAKKLKECQVFGVSSDECLNYAIQNRNEWEKRGQQILTEMKEELGIPTAVLEEELTEDLLA